MGSVHSSDNKSATATQVLAYAYLRVSGRGQEDGDGFPRQLESIKRFAAEQGITIAHVYQDTFTGTEDDRPQYMEMLEAMMDNGVKIVVVECLDRLARELMVQSLLLSKLESEGLSLYNAMTGECVTAAMREDPMRRAMVQIQGVFAELDKNLLIAKLRKARERKKQRTNGAEGKEGQKPYGSKEGEQAGLDLIANRLAAGDGPQAIAQQLNQAGILTRRGCKWNRGSVHRIAQRLS
jgi:DNA invertase Pin-like site-specific DNA recombinase